MKMKFLLVLGFLTLAVSAIWPKAEYLQHGHEVLWLSRDVKFTCRSSDEFILQSMLDGLWR